MKRFVPLTRKINLIIVFSLVVGVGVVITYFAYTQNQSLQRTTEDNLRQQSDILFQSVENAMLPGEAPIAVQLFDDIRLANPGGIPAPGHEEEIHVNRVLPVACVAVFLLLVSACRDERRGPYVPAESEYTGWQQPTSVVLDFPIPGHEDTLRRIYINEIGTRVSAEMRENRTYWNYPEGTMIVKEIFSGPDPDVAKRPTELTVMIKEPEAADSRGGWLWISKDVSSGEETIIDWEFCFDCHANANEPHPYGDGNRGNEFRDYVFFPYRKE